MSVNDFQIFDEKEISSPFTPAYLTNSTFMICTNECRIRISRDMRHWLDLICGGRGYNLNVMMQKSKI